MTETLESIRLAVWLILALLAVACVLLYVIFERQRNRDKGDSFDWRANVELPYERGEFEKVLDVLATHALLFPKSASMKYWQGRCHFRLEEWQKAADLFEECCRLEPPYRRSVRDYMAFIELNALVPGVEGYLEDAASERDA